MTEGKLQTSLGTFDIAKPLMPSAKINITAIPTEFENSLVEEKVNLYGAGTVPKIERGYHRNTRIQNDYRTVHAENYKPGTNFRKYLYPMKSSLGNASNVYK